MKISIVSRVQRKSWAAKALETVNCCAFLKRKVCFFYNQLSKCCQVGMSHWLFDSNYVGNVKCQLYVSH
jgi:hypothetical protein